MGLISATGSTCMGSSVMLMASAKANTSSLHSAFFTSRLPWAMPS